MISEDKLLGNFPDWAKVLIIGGGLWLLTLATASVTGQLVLLPSVGIIGSFTPPIAFAMWARDRMRQAGKASALSIGILVRGFVVAGCIGVLASSVLELYLIADRPSVYFVGVAVIEESVKLAVLWVLATRLQFYTRRDGMLLGMAVGLGFGGFESAGYVFSQVWQQGTIDFGTIISTELVRGLLSPFGHVLLTGLLGGAFFAAAKNKRLRITTSVVGWWLAAVAIHLLWDLSRSIGMAAAWLLNGEPIDSQAFLTGTIHSATTSEIAVITVVSWAVLISAAACGVLLFVRMWKLANRAQLTPCSSSEHSDREGQSESV